jgi:hypothetical protein
MLFTYDSGPISLVQSRGENELQFTELNFIQKFDNGLNRLIGIIEYTIRDKCFNMAEKPEVGRCQARTVWRMRNSHEGIFVTNCLDAFEKEPDNRPGGHTVEVNDLLFPEERL